MHPLGLTPISNLFLKSLQTLIDGGLPVLAKGICFQEQSKGLIQTLFPGATRFATSEMGFKLASLPDARLPDLAELSNLPRLDALHSIVASHP